MRRRRAALLGGVVVLGLLWQPLLYPGGKAALLLLDVYGPSLLGRDVAGSVTPPPRYAETRETLAGVAMRVSWWRPGWGDDHPALLIVNGATPLGNDNDATRRFGASLARAGYLVMLPEFPFLVEGRLDPGAPRVVDAAFAHLRGLRETAGHPAGAFGASVGAGVLLAAAGTQPGLAGADHLTVLGGYFDLDTYVASVATRSQASPPAGVAPWEPSAEASERIPPAVEAAMADDADRAKVRAAFASRSYAEALDLLRSVSPAGRDAFARLSPSTAWARVAPPVFWIHDPDDTYEPLSEAYAAQAARRGGSFRLVVPRLFQHAVASGGAASRGPLFVIGELWGLLTFTLEVLRIAG
jgi:dienelactone hydrolase